MFVFYDFETTGTSPAFDQPLQFAAILTDDEFEPQNRLDIRCRLAPHILPAPWALAVTGVTPDQLTDPELPSLFEFMQQISELIADWGPATWVGYNSIGFDEELMRQAFYQNLHPGIYRTQTDGNDRLDVMKLVYATWELSRDSLEWPENGRGQAVFKLDQLAPANGFEHHDAHDALGDVEATIHIAKLIRERAPEVWQQALRNRSKQEVIGLLGTGEPLRLVERFGAAPPRSYIGAFAGRNPDNPNTVGFLDLELVDPEALAQGDDAALMAAVSGTPKLIRSVKVNSFPSLYTGPELTPEMKTRTDALKGMPELHERVGAALAQRFAGREEPEHVEQQIYGGFPSVEDSKRLQVFQSGTWEERVRTLGEFEDRRFVQLGRRVIYAGQPELLAEEAQERMVVAINDRWTAEDAPWATFAKVDRQLEELRVQNILNADQLAALRAFYDELEARGD